MRKTKKKTIKEIVITKIIEASREDVFRAWITPEYFIQWFGPKDFSVPICHLESEPDGEIYLELEDLEGKRYPMKGEFEEVEPNEEMVFTLSIIEDENGKYGLTYRGTVNFREDNGNTIINLRLEVLSDVTISKSLTGLELGWSQSLDKLGEFMMEI